MEHNLFSDMEEDEKRTYLGLIEPNNTRSERAVSTSTFTSYLSKKKHFIFKRTTSVTLPTSIGKINLTFNNYTLLMKLNKNEFLQIIEQNGMLQPEAKAHAGIYK